MTDEMRRMAAEMMKRDSDTAGTAQPEHLVSVAFEKVGVLADAEAMALVSMTFMSRTGGSTPHVVTVGADGTVVCTCRASRACWAKLAMCRVTGRVA